MPATIDKQPVLQSTRRRLSKAVANLQRHSPFDNIEWVSLNELNTRSEEWRPKRKSLVAASCDITGVDLFFQVD